jgi:hypothetical protein
MKLKHVAVSAQLTTLVVISLTLAVLCSMATDIRDLVDMFRDEQQDDVVYEEGGYWPEWSTDG